MFRTAAGTLALWAVGAVLLRVTVIGAEVCPPLDSSAARAAAVRAGDWIVAVQRSDGTYLYEYDRETQTESPDYNVVRHAGVTMSLYQLVAAGEAGFLGSADLGLDYMEANLIRGPGWAAFRDPRGGRISLGANALLLAGLAQRRLGTGDAALDPLMRDVGAFLVRLQRPDGSFLAEWDESIAAPVPGVTSKYATGEAYWALALMHRFFPAEGWDRPVRDVARYLATRRDAAEGFSFPPWADQWAAYGLSEMADWPISDEEARYAESLAERFGFLVRVEARRTDGWLSERLHGRQARAAGLGTWVEGLGALWTLAGAEPRLLHLKGAIAERAACGAGMLADRQVLAGEPQPAGGPPLAGAWFTRGVTRMDDQQHALSGLLLAERILRERER